MAASFWEVHTHGGRRGTGLEAVAWARQVEELGAGEIVLTSMDAGAQERLRHRDHPRGQRRGEHTGRGRQDGAGKPEHLAAAILDGRADAALAASIFHFGEFTIAETKEVMRAAGIAVRK